MLYSNAMQMMMLFVLGSESSAQRDFLKKKILLKMSSPAHFFGQWNCISGALVYWTVGLCIAVQSGVQCTLHLKMTSIFTLFCIKS